jgi:hypothetical protein
VETPDASGSVQPTRLLDFGSRYYAWRAGSSITSTTTVSQTLLSRHLDREASERRAIYYRLQAIESAIKRRRSRGIVRYLVAATLAWQSYGETTKQIIATTAPELGWSPETRQMITGWMQQLGWTKQP